MKFDQDFAVFVSYNFLVYFHCFFDKKIFDCVYQNSGYFSSETRGIPKFMIKLK